MIDTNVIKHEIKFLASKQGMTYKELIERMNKKYDQNYSMNNLTNKFAKGTIRIHEISMLLDILGYDITISINKKDPKAE